MEIKLSILILMLYIISFIKSSYQNYFRTIANKIKPRLIIT